MLKEIIIGDKPNSKYSVISQYTLTILLFLPIYISSDTECRYCHPLLFNKVFFALLIHILSFCFYTNTYMYDLLNIF